MIHLFIVQTVGSSRAFRKTYNNRKGTVDKERYYIHRNLIERFDGNTVYFKITKDQAEQYKNAYI